MTPLNRLAIGKVGTAGSFEAGVDGALPGIVMPGSPQVGDKFRQEYAKGVAEDTGEVVDLHGADTTPLTGAARDLVVTKDADMLEPIRMRCLFLLDAGTSLDELEAFAAEAHHPAVTYALAVRLARRHRYAEALQLTEGLVFPADFMVRPWGDEHNLDEDLRPQRQRRAGTGPAARRRVRSIGWFAGPGRRVRRG